MALAGYERVCNSGHLRQTRWLEDVSNAVEVVMSQTAVGLFEDAGVAEAVVGSLRAHGFPSGGIRVVSAPKGASIDSSDFGLGFSKDLRAMGVSEYESGAYFSAVQRGRVLVYATGTAQQTDEAVGIMDEFGALEIEELASVGAGVGKAKGTAVKTTDMGTVNPESRLPESQVTIGAHEKSYTSHSSRAKKEGARVFSW